MTSTPPSGRSRPKLLLVRVLVLAVLYTLLVALDRLFGRKVALAAFALAIVGVCVAHASGCMRTTNVATYNVRDFGPQTDLARLTEIVSAVDPDVLALQEVAEPARVKELARRLSAGGRRYASTVSRCGDKLRLALVYDTAAVKLTSTEEIPDLDPNKGGCDGNERPGLVARFERDGRAFRLLVVHLAAGSDPARFAKRKEQWRRVYALVAKMRRESSDPVIVVGDVNSTGYLDDANGERSFVRDSAKSEGLSLESDGLGCTEYFGPRGRLSPSLLDHVVATPGAIRWATPRVHGYCPALRCEPHQGEPPRDFTAVSDHCPVSFRVKTGLF
ncbi:MAG: endonuclease/exonuclease/phosphatase family protein [Myxococcales bacterium]|jgi:endonuclease/exonuclease/phosphatase family metal-dependent hydrolase|nr:endonuclease/exonuclease/phosphatase family protein [Myxococcales bacterium]